MDLVLVMDQCVNDEINHPRRMERSGSVASSSFSEYKSSMAAHVKWGSPSQLHELAFGSASVDVPPPNFANVILRVAAYAFDEVSSSSEVLEIFLLTEYSETSAAKMVNLIMAVTEPTNNISPCTALGRRYSTSR